MEAYLLDSQMSKSVTLQTTDKMMATYLTGGFKATFQESTRDIKGATIIFLSALQRFLLRCSSSDAVL